MKKNKQFKIYATYFKNLNSTIEAKDPFQIPLAVQKYFPGIRSKFISFNDTKDSNNISKKYKNNFELIFLRKIRFYKYNFDFLSIYFYLISNARSIDYFFYYYFGKKPYLPDVLIGLFYKFFNKKGNLILRLEYSSNLYPESFPLVESLTWQDSLYNYVVKRLFSVVDIFAAPEVSELTSIRAKKNIRQNNGARIISIYNGFTLPKDIIINDFKKKRNLVSIVGRLNEEWKGLSVLLNAISDIDLKDWQINCIGEFDGIQFTNKHPNLIEKVISKHGHKVNFCGHISKKTEYYKLLNDSKIIINIYEYDGFPLSLSEALGLGNVPIVSDLPNYNYLTGYGEFGFIIPVKDVEKLKLLLEDIIDHKYDLETMSAKANKFAKNNLTWENIVKKLPL